MLNKLLGGDCARQRDEELRKDLLRLIARNSELKRLAATRARSQQLIPRAAEASTA